MARKIYKRMKKHNRKHRNKRRAQQIFHFKRSAVISNIVASNDGTTVVDIKGAYVAALQQLPEYTDFTSLFQQYRINAVKYEFIPAPNVTGATVSTNQPIYWGQFGSALDFDDNVTPTTEDELLTSQSYKKTRATSVHSRYFRPKMLREIYNGSGPTALEPCAARWISTIYPEVPHYGLKVWCDAPTPPSSGSMSIEYTVRMTLWFSCKNTQ